MKLSRLFSLSKHHNSLCIKVNWYSRWHKHPYHKHVHWLTLFVFVLFSSIIVYNSYVFKPCSIQADKDSADAKALADKNEKTIAKIDKIDISNEDLPAQAGIINIDEIATFADELAENIGKIDISDKQKKEKGEEKKNGNENENGNKNKDENGDEDNNEQDVNDEGNEEENDEQGEDGEDNEENIETPPVEEEPTEETPPLIEEPEIIPIVPIIETATVLDVTSPIRNNKYRTGPMSIYVVYSKIVKVNGSPLLALATGNPSETLIDYRSGSGTNTLIFTYKIASTNFSLDLDYASINSLSLNGGSIKDLAGNDASILLPAPGSTHSLGANKDIAIDTIIRKPTVL